MKDTSLYEKIPSEEYYFPIRLLECYEEFRCHYHEHTEMLFFTNGSAEILCNNNSYTVNAGDLIIVNGNELHTCVKSDNPRFYCAIINPIFFRDVGFYGTLFPNVIYNDKSIKQSFEKIFSEKSSKNKWNKMSIKGEMYSLIAYILRNYENIQLNSYECNERIKNSKCINKILNYIEEHYNENISTSDLAKTAFLSEYYLCRFFKRHTGMTITEYINALRIDKAIAILKSEQTTITDAAIASGFNDVNYFGRVFKKLTGKSPSAYLNKL